MSSPTWIGQTLNGRYFIQELLGQGGMSAVYKASDPNLKRVVAIKLIHPHLATDAQFVQRFQEEATAVASLRHPNIVQVFDFSSDKDVSYMVLEFIPGETLQENLRRLAAQKRSMDLNQAIKITLNICDALAYAHQRGMIHRDIKPANIMLDVYGQAILMDFGIVKILGGAQHTATGAVMGTARYMSPELIRSEPADQRADIYSLGVTLYEMLSGKTPFEADSAMTLMMMHLNDPVPDPRSLRQDLPPALVAILNRCLAKDRNQRYQSVNELANDLKQVQASLDNPAATAAQPVTILPPVRPQPAAAPQSPSGGTMNAATLYEQPVRRSTPPGGYSPPPPGYDNPPSPAAGYPPPAKKGLAKRWWFAIGAAALLLFAAVITGAIIIFNSNFSGDKPATLQPSALAAIVETATFAPTASATETAVSSFSLTLTANAVVPPVQVITPSATNTPEPSPTPTATYPPLYVRINNITLNASNAYVVEYETFGYTEQLPGMHIHFFFNTVSPEQAGMPGSGPWFLYGGPRPFTGYTTSNRPAQATQLCALVANANHTVIQESGNCFDLP